MQKALCTRSDTDLLALRRLAEDLAEERGQKPTTTHLLAAIASGHDEAARLLLERRLDVDVALKAARVTLDDAADAIACTLQKARELAGRSGSGRGDAGAVHALFALCQQAGTAAHRAMVQCGIDVTRLRVVTMQLAMGIAPPRRTVPSKTSIAAMSSQRPSGLVRIAPIAPVSKPASPKVSPKPSPVAPTTHPNAPKAKKQRAAASQSRQGRFSLDPKQFPMLSALGQNLTEAAARGELDPVVGRDEEIEHALDVLAKRHANNACLIGPPGVGKTSLVHGIATRIADGARVACFEDRIVVAIEPASLLAGTAVRGSLAEKLGQLKAEVSRAKGRVILFFDEMHVLFSQDAGDEASSELRLALFRGEIVCIGATTAEDYRRVVDADPGLSRCFTPIDVGELPPEKALVAIESITPLFEQHHACAYEHDALAKAVTWSVRYLPGKALPDKAVQILDLAGARAKRRGESKVDPGHVAEVVSELSGVPEERLLETDAERLLHIEQLLAARIVGHTGELARIATVLRRNASGFRSKRPIGTFLALGPTGVGKTETAKAIAQCLFHTDSAMTRLDLSEYAESHAIARLVGAPPGYVGHDAGGQLTEAVRRRPYQVVLLDEIEKAHRDVLESFLGVFDEGRLTDGRGRTVDFTNTVIVLTSNIGAELSPKARERGRIGFGPPSHGGQRKDDVGRMPAREIEAYRESVIEAARRALPPELYNRLDEVLAFAPLDRDDVAEIARRILCALSRDLEQARGVRIHASPVAIDALLDRGGFDPEMGARPMRRAIGRYVEAPIAEMILKGTLARGAVAKVDVRNGSIVVDAAAARESVQG
ncbi:MAG: ATP-dependent Clp protease ATP-binding subunit [Polyangiaceae bacterium]|nr:ATP-dependent Clp protease ATP-binding subunit [Polyangiaceae bacterium]